MSNRPTHLDTEYKTALSPRQCEVLDLVARGKTYGEIADALGITLDGVKWHMREVLTKLGLNSREEAAEWWRKQRSIPRRLSRLVRILPVTGVKLALAGAATTAIAGVAIAGIALASWGGSSHNAAASVDAAAGGGSATGCPTSMAELGGGAVDYQNGEYVTINIGAGGFTLPAGLTSPPPCIVEDDLQIQLEMDGKPLDIEGNGVWFHVKGDFRPPSQRKLTPAMIDFKWVNWCGNPGTAQIILKAEHFPVQDQKAPTPNCIDKSQPSRLIVLSTEP